MNHIFKGKDLTVSIIIDNFYHIDEKLNEKEKSAHWKKHINNKNYSDLNNDLKNFRKNGLSTGLDDKYDLKIIKKNFAKVLANPDYNFWKKIADVKNIGNNDNFITHDNYFIDVNLINEVTWLSSIRKETSILDKAKIVCEIGSGFGSLSSKIKKINPLCKFILIDLPESNILSSYFLSKQFPESYFLLNNPSVLNTKDFEKIDFIIINPNIELRNLNVDLFINARSMQEMNSKNINNYFNFIQANIVEYGYLLNINAYTKSTVGENINIADYNYDKYWSVIISEPTYFQDHIHLLLTQRNFKNFNIFIELQKIKELENKLIDKYPFILLRRAKHLKYSKLKLLNEYLRFYFKLFIKKFFKNYSI